MKGEGSKNCNDLPEEGKCARKRFVNVKVARLFIRGPAALARRLSISRKAADFIDCQGAGIWT